MHKCFIVAVAALLASPAWSNTLVSNVNGLQVGADGKLQRFSALLIGDDGKVLNTFTSLDNVRVAASQSIDGGGRTLLPGLIDGHGHVISSPGGGAGLGLFLQQLDLTQTRSLADLQRRLAGYASNEAAAGWIQGRGWNQESWSEKKFPTAAMRHLGMASA